MAAKGPPGGGEFGPQVLGIVQLAVIGHDEPAAGRRHGLASGFRQVDDGKPSMGQGHARGGIDPGAPGVGAAMPQRLGLLLRRATQGGFLGATGQAQDSRNSAHGA